MGAVSNVTTLVYFGDMLAVAQDRRALLERVHRWLRPGGALAITDIVAGPDLSDKIGHSFGQEDGFDVPFQADSLAMIRDVGFQNLDVTDLYAHGGHDCKRRSCRRRTGTRQTLVDAVGADNWLNWVECARVYGRLFAERKLVSLRIGTHRA